MLHMLYRELLTGRLPSPFPAAAHLSLFLFHSATGCRHGGMRQSAHMSTMAPGNVVHWQHVLTPVQTTALPASLFLLLWAFPRLDLPAPAGAGWYQFAALYDSVCARVG